jgi:hypothetical protein
MSLYKRDVFNAEAINLLRHDFTRVCEKAAVKLSKAITIAASIMLR